MLGLLIALCCICLILYLVSWGMAEFFPGLPRPIRGIVLLIVLLVLLGGFWFGPVDMDWGHWRHR